MSAATMSAAGPPPTVRLIVVGGEVLDGFVADANIRLVALRMRECGVRLDRVTVVDDDADAIADEVRSALAGPRPMLVVTTGGTGGTWDDVTYRGIAVALGRELTVARELAEPLGRIIDWTEAEGYQLDSDAVDGMMRIATIPAGSTVHFVSSWLACVQTDLDGGLAVRDGATVVALPGPPGHVQRLIDELVLPVVLADRRGTVRHVDVTHEYPETLLVGELRRVHLRHPEVTLGSYPGEPMTVRFSGTIGDVSAAAAELTAFLATLDRHPGAAALRRAWRRQTPWTQPDARAAAE
jgi:molybdopterin-biosynthesis enzyme MoeA-like protein